MTHICSNPRDVLIATARALAETASHPDHKAEWAALADELDSGRPGAEPQGPPVDGREVDQAPESGHQHVVTEWIDGVITFFYCYCPIGRDHREPPQTGDRAADPPAPAPSP